MNMASPAQDAKPDTRVGMAFRTVGHVGPGVNGEKFQLDLMFNPRWAYLV